MIRINQIKIPVFEVGTDRENEKRLVRGAAVKLLGCRYDSVRKLRIIRRSIDAREKNNILYVYTADIKLHDSVAGPDSNTEAQFIRRLRNNNIRQSAEVPFALPEPIKDTADRPAPVIVGSGPCGLFAAYVLAECGIPPVILERGDDVDTRLRKTELFFESGKLDPDCNIQFGEGGAGTFSDGKLNTSIKDREGYIGFVLRTFVRFGADPDILIDQKPHIGTDVLSGIIKRMREHIIEKGGRYIFNARFDEIRSENGHVTHAGYTDTVRGTKSYIRCSELIVAAGHSARDTFAMLLKAGLRAEPKPFAVGIRVQHPQEAIDAALYGERDLKRKEAILGPASYKLTHRTVKGRSCYSFCMCPGGYVVNSSSEEGRLCINGMSYNSRASGTANSAVIVNVLPEDYRDYGEDPVLSGIEFQRRLEELAYKAGGGVIPYETFGEFKRGESSPSGVSSFPFEFLGYAASGDLRSVLPEFVSEAIIESMPAFAGVIKGFDDEDTIVAGVEARTSSPVRILRDEKLQSDIRGIFPAGEGAGYAGGITSAAADGIRTAMYIVDSIYGDQDNGNKR